MTKPKRKPAPPAKKKHVSTALARRPKPKQQRVEVLPAMTAETAVATQLASDPVMTAQFVGTLNLTAEQIAALRRPVEDHEVEWKPLVQDGPPAIPYLGHNGYRDRLDAAFGLGGWGMVPVGAPKEKDSIVYVPFAMVIGGLPRVYVWGEQIYHSNNKQMTYGDALEGAKSNAITRCGKELGIAREMWNKANIARLKGQAPPAGPQGQQQRRQQASPGVEPVVHARTGDPISDKQRRRLWVIVKNSGREEEEVKGWLKRRYQLNSTTEIARNQYDDICKAIEASGPLPEGGR